jgi:hypothetical protein
MREVLAELRAIRALVERLLDVLGRSCQSKMDAHEKACEQGRATTAARGCRQGGDDLDSRNARRGRGVDKRGRGAAARGVGTRSHEREGEAIEVTDTDRAAALRVARRMGLLVRE